MTERDIIDTSLSAVDIGSKVYKFFYNPLTVDLPSNTDPAGKIEELLTGESLDNFYYFDVISQVWNPTFYRMFAKRIARFHSITKEQMQVPERNVTNTTIVIKNC